MSKEPGRFRSDFHEMPLVLFTSCVIAGAGIPAGHFFLWALGMTSFGPSRGPALLSLALLSAGLLLSLLHLGRPARLSFALRRTGRSPLSTEVALALLTMTASAVALLQPYEWAGILLWGLVSVTAPGLLLALGWVYRLPGHLSWKGTAVISPLLLGLAAGCLTQACNSEDNAHFLFAAFVVLVVDASAFALRWTNSKWDSASGNPVHPLFHRMRNRFLILRLTDVNLLPVVFMMAESPRAALFLLAIGILIDRFCFYALALRETTESEIRRVEKHLRLTIDD